MVVRSLLLAAGFLFFGIRSFAQNPASSDPYRTENLNYVYAADLGFGGYALSGLRADVYTLPLAITLRGLPRDGWALRLLLPVQGGLYRFHATDINGAQISINQESLSIMPGAELQIPVGDRFMLKPFLEGGLVRAFGDNVGNPNSWIYVGGVRSVAEWHDGATTFSLGNAVVFAGDKTIGSGFAEQYVSLQVGGEVRRSLGFRIGKFEPDLGIYMASYYYPEKLRFSRFLQPDLRVGNQGEVGFSVGSAAPFRMMFLSDARIGAGFVFGDGLSVWHVNFGFPF